MKRPRSEATSNFPQKRRTQSVGRLPAQKNGNQQVIRRQSVNFLPSSRNRRGLQCDIGCDDQSDEYSDDEYYRYPVEPRRLSLWDRPEPQKKAPKLSSTCKRIEFDSLVKKKMRNKILMGSWNEVRRAQGCPFCRLVTECVLHSGVVPEKDEPVWLDNALNWQLTVYQPYKEAPGFSTFRDARATAKSTNCKTAYSFVISSNETQLGHFQYILKKNPPMRGSSMDAGSTEVRSIYL